MKKRSWYIYFVRCFKLHFFLFKPYHNFSFKGEEMPTKYHKITFFFQNEKEILFHLTFNQLEKNQFIHVHVPQLILDAFHVQNIFLIHYQPQLNNNCYLCSPPPPLSF